MSPVQELPSTGDEDVTMTDAVEYQPSEDAHEDQDMKVRLEDALSGCVGRGEMHIYIWILRLTLLLFSIGVSRYTGLHGKRQRGSARSIPMLMVTAGFRYQPKYHRK